MAAGIAFAILMPVGTIVQFSGLPNYDGSKDSSAVIAQKVHDALADSGHRAAVIVGAYLLIAASLCLVWFALGLRARLVAQAPERALAGSLVSGFGLVAGVGLSVGGALNAIIPGSISFGGDPVPAASSSDSARFITQLGTPMIFLVFGLAIAALAATTSVCALQGVGLPRWLGYAGGLAVLGGAFGVLFEPLVLVVLWAIAVGVVGLRAVPAAPPATRVGAPTPG